MANVTTEKVWREVDRQMFAVVGMVSARGEARTAGVVYLVEDGKLVFGTARDEWKTRHILANSDVSVTVPIAKRIPFLPWVRIPAATITFAATARVLNQDEAPPAVAGRLEEGLTEESGELPPSVIVELTPRGDFITYGVGVSLSQMRDTGLARGRVPVAV